MGELVLKSKVLEKEGFLKETQKSYFSASEMHVYLKEIFDQMH